MTGVKLSCHAVPLMCISKCMSDCLQGQIAETWLFSVPFTWIRLRCCKTLKGKMQCDMLTLRLC